ncbi:MAG: hypothetical protein LBK61_11710, partial [Spirochaetaceae bacterium]|nr:hypothetical protein [Spirochaetaceae bacterium]
MGDETTKRTCGMYSTSAKRQEIKMAFACPVIMSLISYLISLMSAQHTDYAYNASTCKILTDTRGFLSGRISGYAGNRALRGFRRLRGRSAPLQS